MEQLADMILLAVGDQDSSASPSEEILQIKREKKRSKRYKVSRKQHRSAKRSY